MGIANSQTCPHPGTRWDSVVEKICKDIGGNQEDILSIEKFAGYKTEEKERIRETRERLALKNKVTEEGHLDLRGVKRRNRNET